MSDGQILSATFVKEYFRTVVHGLSFLSRAEDRRTDALSRRDLDREIEESDKYNRLIDVTERELYALARQVEDLRFPPADLCGADKVVNSHPIATTTATGATIITAGSADHCSPSSLGSRPRTQMLPANR